MNNSDQKDTVVADARKIIKTLDRHLSEENCKHNVHEIFAGIFEE